MLCPNRPRPTLNSKKGVPAGTPSYSIKLAEEEGFEPS